MTFARKLTAVILLLLCLTLSAGGAWTVQQNFAALRTAAEQQAAAQHLRDCFAIETAIEEAGATVVDAAMLGRLARERAAAGAEQPTRALYLRNPDIAPPSRRKRAS